MTPLLSHPLWPQIATHVVVQLYTRDGGFQKPRFRLEFDKEVSQEQQRVWTQIQVPCVACGTLIHPVRERVASKRGKTGHLYLAPSCPLEERMGCSRGLEVHQAYLEIRQSVERLKANLPPVPQQAQLL